ncbi:MAG: Bug family tripartite tricarboxylate transporter substrate binding protein, partial [Xanthobacteraceae bacterium]
ADQSWEVEMKRHAFTSAHIVALLRAAALALCLAAPLWPAAAWAQTYPAKPIKLIVPFPAGGPADLFARSLGHGLGTELSQQIIIENRAGTGGLAGVDALAKSAPDGYTIGINGAAALSAIPFMVSKMPFDWQTDLALLTLVVRVPEVLTVHPSLGANTFGDFLTYARAHPGKINFGSAGAGSITHLAGELFKTEAKLDLVHVPYRGVGPAVTDMLGGHIQMIVADVPFLLPHIRSGAIRPLAVTSAARSAALPDVPTTAELGYPGINSDNWYGLVAPGGTPAEILDKLRKASVTVLRSEELKKQFDSQSAVPSPTTPDEFAAFVRTEQAKWGPLVLATGAKLE